MHTELTTGTPVRRRRRIHSREFKAEAIKACQQAGVSLAAVALARGINANLLRRWVREAETIHAVERDGAVTVTASPMPASSGFVALNVQDPEVPKDIRIELRRGPMTVTMSWPAAAAAECASWLRELLR